MATLHNARAFFAPARHRPDRRRGATPTSSWSTTSEAFSIQRVIVGGKTYVEDGRLVEALPAVEYPAYLYDTVKLPAPVTADDFDHARIRRPSPSRRV